MAKPEVVLLVEDNPVDAQLVQVMLARAAAGDVVVHRVASLRAALEILTTERPDCVLLDLSLPDTAGLDGLLAIQRVVPDTPVVVLTGEGNQGLALEAIKSGAQDYLIKGSVDPAALERALRYAVERKRAELELLHRALHDPLTDLPNRSLLLDRLTMSLARLERRGGSIALIFADLDGFKGINDSLGHEDGDRVLVEVARRFRVAVRPDDTVARFSGDEFVVLCDGPFAPGALGELAGRLRDALVPTIDTVFGQVTLSTSLGVVTTTDPRSRPERLLREADLAMYQAKRQGPGRYEVYDEIMSEQHRGRLDTEANLRLALDRQEFRLVYQPIVSLSDGRVVGCEALIRWENQQVGTIPPAAFIPVAEETGLIVPIGAWVMREACAQVERWRLSGHLVGPFILSVNVSARQLLSSEFGRLVVEGRARAGDMQLWLELTETAMLEEVLSSSNALERVRGPGVSIALDDFGTGYASLQSLRRFPVDVVKVDGSFVAGMDRNRSDRAIVEAVLGLAAGLELTAVAECVETADQARVLGELGCPLAQGYFFSHPLVPSDMVATLGTSLPAPTGAP